MGDCNFIGWVLEARYGDDWGPAGGPYSWADADERADELLEDGADEVSLIEAGKRDEPKRRFADQ